MKLFDELSRLLEYSGREVKEKSITADGATAIIKLDNEEFRIFVAPVKEFMPRLNEPVNAYGE